MKKIFKSTLSVLLALSIVLGSALLSDCIISAPKAEATDECTMGYEYGGKYLFEGYEKNSIGAPIIYTNNSYTLFGSEQYSVCDFISDFESEVIEYTITPYSSTNNVLYKSSTTISYKSYNQIYYSIYLPNILEEEGLYSINIDFPGLNCETHETYTNLSSQVGFYLAQSYTLSYYLNGGVSGPSSQSNCNKYTISSVVPQKRDYVFAGWSTNINATTPEYQPGDTIELSRDTTLYAIWEPITPTTYTLTYNANGGSGAPSSQTGSSSYTISYSIPTRDGYTFLGWSTSRSSSYATYDAGDTITLTSNTTLYAVWEKNYTGAKVECGRCGAMFDDDEELWLHLSNHPYALSYNANGGSGAPYTQTCAKSYTISSTKPTRSGYTFLGWSTSSSATYATYDAGDTITLTSNTTLYAVWSKNASTDNNDNIKVTIRNNPGTRTLNYGDTVRIYADAQNLPTGAKIGWFANNQDLILSAVAPDGTYCEITADGTGTITLEAKAVDTNGNIITDSQGNWIGDTQKINVKTSLWLRIVSFFKNLFGMNRTTVQFFKGMF